MHGGIKYNAQKLSKVRASIGYVTQACGPVEKDGSSCETPPSPSRRFRSFNEIQKMPVHSAEEDIMYETLTPRENLTFAAAFILPKLSNESRSTEVGQLGNLENYELSVRTT